MGQRWRRSSRYWESLSILEDLGGWNKDHRTKTVWASRSSQNHPCWRLEWVQRNDREQLSFEENLQWTVSLWVLWKKAIFRGIGSAMWGDQRTLWTALALKNNRKESARLLRMRDSPSVPQMLGSADPSQGLRASRPAQDWADREQRTGCSANYPEGEGDIWVIRVAKDVRRNFFSYLATPRSQLQHVGSSSLTRDWTQVAYSGSTESCHWTTREVLRWNSFFFFFSEVKFLMVRRGATFRCLWMMKQTLPVHLGVHGMMSTLCSFFPIFRPLPSSGLSLIKNMNFNCSKDRSAHRSPATGFVASRNKQVSSAKFSQYPVREPCLNCFDVSASFYHEEKE